MEQGLLVENVDGAAARAGVEVGDLLIAIKGRASFGPSRRVSPCCGGGTAGRRKDLYGPCASDSNCNRNSNLRGQQSLAAA